MVRPVHIIIGFTPYHALFAERLVPTISGDIECVFTKSWPSSDGYRRAVYISRGPKFLRSLTYALSLFFFLVRLRVFQLFKRPIHAYVPHPCNAFSYAVFAIKDLASLSVYEDGLANYYDAPMPSHQFLNRTERALLSIFGFRLGSMTGHLGGYDVRHVDNLFLSRGDFAVSKEKVGRVVSLPFREVEVTLSTTTILFLDQDTSKYISTSDRDRRLRQLFDIYSPEEYEYIYKPHHDYNARLPKMRVLQGKFESMPAEKLVSEVGAGIVVSFYSSALLNLKNIYPQVKCVSIGGDAVNVSIDGQPQVIAELFLRSDIDCIANEVK